MAEYPSNTYGKRSVWQWIVIYVVIAAIVYGLIYYFIKARNNNSYNSGSSTPSTQGY